MGTAKEGPIREPGGTWKRRAPAILGVSLALFGWSAVTSEQGGTIALLPRPQVASAAEEAPPPHEGPNKFASNRAPQVTIELEGPATVPVPSLAPLPAPAPAHAAPRPDYPLVLTLESEPVQLDPLPAQPEPFRVALPPVVVSPRPGRVGAGADFMIRPAGGPPAASVAAPAIPATIPGTVDAVGRPVLPARQPAPLPVPQPAPGGKADGQPLPAPRPFPADERRLPRLASPLGTTPRPTEKDLAEFRQFIDGVIDPRNTLDLIEGRSRLLVMKVTPSQTQVADQNVLSLGVLGPNQLSLIGKKPGSTVLTLFFPDPKDKTKEHVLSYLVRVLPDPEAKERLEATYKVLEKEINCAFPNSRVCLALVGDKLMVSGQAHDIQEAFQIMRIARANAPGATQDAGAQAGNQAGKVPPIPNVAPVEAAGDPTNPTGTPGLSNYQTSGGPNVINNLRIPGEQQVMLKVTVAEVNRAAARSIGVNYSVINNRGTTVFAQMTGNLGSSGLGGLGSVGSANGIIGASGTTGLGGSPGLGGVTGGAGVNLPINIDSGQLPILLNALRNLNYARSLAEPNLTAMNGQTATFLAGGQFPVPVLGGLGGFGAGGAGGLAGLQGVQFVPFGVQLAFTPLITDRDRIRLSVRATVSTRDLNTGANVGGTAVPGLSARTFSTTVELREGQTLAVAGLIQNNLGAESSRVPFFGDLPLVGNLSGVSRIQHGEQELVILITPELVHPLDAKERPALPGSDLFEPGDTEFYVLGRLESRRAYDYRSPVRTDVHRMLNYRRCEEKYIFGPTGYSAPAGK